MPDGSPPTWDTVRQRYWRNCYEASRNTGEFSADNLRRINRGTNPTHNQDVHISMRPEKAPFD